MTQLANFGLHIANNFHFFVLSINPTQLYDEAVSASVEGLRDREVVAGDRSRAHASTPENLGFKIGFVFFDFFVHATAKV